MTEETIVKYIDHTLLKSTATSEEIKKLCREAKEYKFFAVPVNGRWVSLAADELDGSGVKVGGVVSFPLGADSTQVKVLQTKQAIMDGADEIDMVADLAMIIEKDEKSLIHQLSSVLDVCRSMKPAVTLKVIIEAAVLTREQKIFVCEIANRCRVDFVKTSTGMNSAGGAAIEDVKLMKQHAPNCKIKASGGIRTAKQAIELIQAGADRIGTSASVEIIEEIRTGKI